MLFDFDSCEKILIAYSYLKIERTFGRAIGDNTKGFKVRINQYISDYKTKISTTCNMNNCLQEPFLFWKLFYESDRLKTIEIISIKRLWYNKQSRYELTINVTKQIWIKSFKLCFL